VCKVLGHPENPIEKSMTNASNVSTNVSSNFAATALNKAQWARDFIVSENYDDAETLIKEAEVLLKEGGGEHSFWVRNAEKAILIAKEALATANKNAAKAAWEAYKSASERGEHVQVLDHLQHEALLAQAKV
jgi:hypothetical protein